MFVEGAFDKTKHPAVACEQPPISGKQNVGKGKIPWAAFKMTTEKARASRRLIGRPGIDSGIQFRAGALRPLVAKYRVARVGAQLSISERYTFISSTFYCR